MINVAKKWQKAVNWMHQKGIPVPFLRDPKSGKPSVSLTLVFLSFNIWLVSIIGEATRWFGGIDPSQTFNMFIATASLYWGRKLTSPATNKESDKNLPELDTSELEEATEKEEKQSNCCNSDK